MAGEVCGIKKHRRCESSSTRREHEVHSRGITRDRQVSRQATEPALSRNGDSQGLTVTRAAGAQQCLFSSRKTGEWGMICPQIKPVQGVFGVESGPRGPQALSLCQARGGQVILAKGKSLHFTGSQCVTMVDWKSTFHGLQIAPPCPRGLTCLRRDDI